MKRDIRTLIILLLSSAAVFVLLSTCETDDFDMEEIDCADCFEEKPETSYLLIRYSQEVNDTVRVEIFRGYVDQSMMEWSGYAFESPLFLYSTPVDNYYSVKLTYTVDSSKISVIDAGVLETEYIRNYCENNCYIIKGREMDLRLK